MKELKKMLFFSISVYLFIYLRAYSTAQRLIKIKREQRATNKTKKDT
jgi:hypothetical protein